MVFMKIACLLLITVHASNAFIDRSSDEVIDYNMKGIIDLNKNLPAIFFCCKGNDILTNEDWIVLCLDKNNVTYNITMSCNLPHFYGPEYFEPGFFEFFIKNNEVYFGSEENASPENPNRTCFGNETTTGTSNLKVIMCLDDDNEVQKDFEDVPNDIKKKAPIAGALSLLSAPFTALVIIIYSSISELRDLQGQSILCLCISYLCTSVMIANEDLQILEVNRMCHAAGDILYFFLMANVFWMSAISIQTFLNIRFPTLSVTWSRQFVWYSLFAWSAPTLLLFCATMSDIVPGMLILRGMDLTFNCSRFDDAYEWIYYLGPMCAAVGVSGSLFLYSGLLLHWMQPNEPCFKSLRYRYFLSLKLFAVVGISWLNEPFQKLHGEISIIWICGDCWNLLQGVLLFLVLVLLRKQVMRATLDKYTFCATPWLRQYTDMLKEDDDVANMSFENNLAGVNTSHNEAD